MPNKSVVLRALEAYQTKLKKEYDKLNEVISGSPETKLLEVFKEAHELINNDDRFSDKTIKRIEELSADEKKYKIALKKSNNPKTYDKWSTLKIELNELAAEISRQQWRFRQ